MSYHSTELASVMNSLGLTPESKLYRYTSKNHINKDNNGKESILAKDDPGEMIIDTYEGVGHTHVASEIGSGLAFVLEIVPVLESEERTCCEITLKNILDQGGLVYRVVSQPAYIKAIFCTLPTGKVYIDIF